MIVSEVLPQLTGNQSWNGLTLTNYATAPNGGQLDLVIVSGTGEGIISGGDASNTLELQYTDGSAYEGPWVYAFRGLTTFKDIYVEEVDYEGLLVPPGEKVSDGGFASSGEERISTGEYSGQKAGIIFNKGRVRFRSDGFGGTISAGPGGEQAFYNSRKYAEVTLGTASNTNGSWQKLRLTGGFEGKDRIEIRLTGDGAEAYFDNIRAYVQTTDADAPEAVATDHGSRRHIVACRDGLHEVSEDGVVSALGELPFQPSLAAAHGDTTLVAGGTGIAISTDGGATWDQHTASAGVKQIFASPTPVAILVDGDVVSVATSGLTSEHSFGAEHWLAYARRPGEWVACDVNGEIQVGGLSSWSAGISQPSSFSFLKRRVLPLEAGRRIGWTEDGRDVFYRDLSAAGWDLGFPLVDDIKAMKEVK